MSILLLATFFCARPHPLKKRVRSTNTLKIYRSQENSFLFARTKKIVEKENVNQKILIR